MPKDPATENMEAIMQKPLRAFPTQDHDAHIQHIELLCLQEWFKLIHKFISFTSSHI